jgi:hypothetical protein
MYFLEHNMAPNSPMDVVQTKVVAKFIGELINLGVLLRPAPEQPVLVRGPDVLP